MFYNVVGVPPAEAAAVPREDGKRIIEQAAGFCSLGGRFNKLPGFATADSLNVDVFETILNEGAVFIDRLDADGKYSWVDDTVESDDLEALHSAVQSGGDTEAILGEWEEYAWEHSKDEPVPSTTDAEKNPSKDETPSPKSPIQSHKGQSGTRENTNGPLNAQDIRRDDTSEAFDGKKSAGEDDQAEHQPDREDLLEELARLYESKRSVPTRSDVINDGEYPLKLYGKLFASLDDAVGKCEAIQDDSEPVNPFIYSTTDQAADEEYEQDPLGKYFESVNAPKSVRSQVEKAAFNGFSQIEQILDLYEAGELATQPNQLASAALEAKVRTQLEKIRDATGEIVKHHVGDEAVEKPNLDTVINQASTDAPRVYESIKQSEGEAAMTLTDEWNVSQQTDSSLKEDSSRSSTGHSVNDRVPANPLAEYYEIFRNFESFLGRLTRSERTSYRTDQDHPMNRWRDEIEKVVYGSGLNGQSPSYGQQQGNRNPIKITEYREAFGNGETVTEYQCMQTVLLDSDVEMLAEKGVIGSEEQIHVPVAPDSGVQLPIAVSSESELENAINLLQEFPPEPEPAPESQSSSSSVIESDEQSRGPDQPTEDLRTDNEESTTQEQSGQAVDSRGTDTERESVTEQTIFWNRDVERITEYGDEDAETVEANATSNQGTLDKKIDEWKSQLLDLTRRNKLVSFKPTKTKSLPFEETNPTTVADELNGDGKLYIRKRPDEDETHRESVSSDNKLPELTADELLPTRIADEAENSLYQIGLKNKQYLRERGVDCLYLSLGMLRWYSVDHSDDANRSPLFLAPVELEEKTLRDKDRHDYVLKPKAEGLRLNPALRKKLAAERGVDLPADTALSLEEIDAAFESVYETLRGFDRWTIQQDIVLGIFDFTKFSLYSDLERNRAAVKSNPIIRALNGDTEPLQEAEGDIETPAAEELDDVVDPVEMYQVLDADSSQQEAIEAAKRGKSFVLQGPPGTGKSQTIANIIAEKLADGERVLFVSEKQAALDVVKNRLDDVGIGRFCLEVHGEKANNADVLANLEDELKASQIESTNNRARRLRKLRERRETINQYGQYLFYSPDGWDLTVYQAFGIVSEHMNAPRVEISIDHPLDVGQETLREAVDRLETLARFENEIDTHETSPWRHTTLTQRDVDMKDSMRRSLNQQLDVLDELIETADELDTNLGVRPQSLSEFRDVSQLLHHLSNRPDIPWQEGFFDESFAQEGSRLEELAELEREREELIDDLTENYQRSFFSANGTELNTELAGYGLLKVFKPSYRSLKREITNHSQEEYDPSYQQVLEDTRKLAEVQHIEDRREDYRGVIQRLGPLYEGEDTDWETLAQAQSWVAELDEFGSSHMSPIIDRLLDGTLPNIESLAEQTQAELNRYSNAATFFESAMVVEEMEVNGQSLRRASLSDLSDALENLRNVVPNLQRRVEFSSQLEKVRGTICEEYVDRFLHSECNGEELVPAFEKRFCTRWLNSVYEHTELGSFSADEMERYIEEFRRLDQEQQELAKIEIQREVTQRRPSLSPEHASSSEQVLIRRETEKQRRHKPLRELFDEAGSFITQVTPCFMMSPLSVAQYLKAGSIQFDAVVFDEASQIMPQDAVSSLIRADQAIIAGDTKQLPPTSFFQSDIETTEDVREDLDSILEETASVLPEKRLRWHYRSRSKELIEFSNYHYYNNSLRTFPENDPDIETGVSFDYVSDGVYDRGGSRRNEVEAQRVIDLIEEHAEDHSEKSLGVVAFSSAQEQAIRDALEERRGESGVLDGFVSQDDVLDEFFIKNLEMVQGDERDRMIFSVGYGPDQAGIVSMNFGPLNKSGGERRLNVTVTRAKEQITVVSSIQPGEIDLTRTNSTGVAHFKNYLEYAQKGDRALARDDSVTSTLDFDSQFEEAVYTALKNEGYDVVSQVQSSSYSIDLAIKHPEQPGKFVLGIECDGAAYHSSKTARDRDRTRQMVLEDLGWTIHRIWSPDWTSNREHEIRKINDKADSLIARRAGSSETDST
jgi:very-short-patch-repair endonuclease